MGDFGGVQSRNMFDVLNQPSKTSKEKAAPKHEAKEAKKAAQRAAQPPPPASQPEAKVRTNNKRGGMGKGTQRVGGAGRGKATADSRGKRYQDRNSDLNFQKNQGAARKGGHNFGGVKDVVDEAADATTVFNETHTSVLTAAEADAKAETKSDEKKEDKKEPEEPDLNKTFDAFLAEKKGVADDVKQARAPIVGKEFKTGVAATKKKGVPESFMKVEEKKEEKKEKKKSAKKEAKEAAVKAAKAAKVPISLEEFRGPITTPPPRPQSATTAAAPATTGDAAPAATGAPRPSGGRGAGGRGAGGARGPRGGGRGRRSPGANLDIAKDFPELVKPSSGPAAK